MLDTVYIRFQGHLHIMLLQTKTYTLQCNSNIQLLTGFKDNSSFFFTRGRICCPKKQAKGKKSVLKGETKLLLSKNPNLGFLG